MCVNTKPSKLASALPRVILIKTMPTASPACFFLKCSSVNTVALGISPPTENPWINLNNIKRAGAHRPMLLKLGINPMNNVAIGYPSPLPICYQVFSITGNTGERPVWGVNPRHFRVGLFICEAI